MCGEPEQMQEKSTNKKWPQQVSISVYDDERKATENPEAKKKVVWIGNQKAGNEMLEGHDIMMLLT